jgi:hypothetical protein
LVPAAPGTLPRMHKRTPLIPAALGALALVPAAASAHGPVAHAAGVGNKIVLYKSIGGIPIGITPSKLRKRLGKPSKTYRVHGKIAEMDYSKGIKPIINVQFDTLHKGDPADGLFGSRSSMHTSKGIHPGSSTKALNHAYGKALHKFPGGFALYQGKPGSLGSVTTQFGTSGGKVGIIDIQAVFKDF